MNEAIWFNVPKSKWHSEKLSDCYCTPQWLFDFLDEQYDFDFDVCASIHNHKLDKYFSLENSAIGADWSTMGAIGFCNPPFSHGSKEKFLNEAYSQMVQHGVSSVFIIPADDCCVWWHKHVVDKATKVTKLLRRINFDEPNRPGHEMATGLSAAIIEFMAGEKPVHYEQDFIDSMKVKKQYYKKPIFPYFSTKTNPYL